MMIVLTRKKFDAICWGLEEPGSHIAIWFLNSIVFHATISGVYFIGINDFLEDRYVVDSVAVPMDEIDEVEVLREMVANKVDLKSYDWKYFSWLLWRVILLKLFRKPIPNTIGSENNSAILCNEAISLLPKRLNIDFDKTRAATPYRTLKAIRESLDGKVLDAS